MALWRSFFCSSSANLGIGIPDVERKCEGPTMLGDVAVKWLAIEGFGLAS